MSSAHHSANGWRRWFKSSGSRSPWRSLKTPRQFLTRLVSSLLRHRRLIRDLWPWELSAGRRMRPSETETKTKLFELIRDREVTFLKRNPSVPQEVHVHTFDNGL